MEKIDKNVIIAKRRKKSYSKLNNIGKRGCEIKGKRKR